MPGVTTKVEGWVAPGWDAVKKAFERNFETGSEVGAAFSAYHKGEKVVDLWGGIADPTTGRPWTEDTLVLVFSTTKGITAMCANRLADQGLLDTEAPVGEYWPEFVQAGKKSVTVADLLAHRAGLAWIDGEMSLQEVLAWDPVIKALGAQAPSWPPGSAHGYHATTFGWLVGEVVRRVSGRSVGAYLKEEISSALDAEFFIGLPSSHEPRVARLVRFSLDELLAEGKGLLPQGTLGEDPANAAGAFPPEIPAPPPNAGLLEMASTYLGADSPLVKALAAPGGAFSDEGLWDTPEVHAAEIPAANGIGDARSLARLYSACVSDIKSTSGDAFRTFSPKQLGRAVHQETEGPDRILFGLDIQWGLGFMLNRGVVATGGMGGPRSFGHFGMGGSVGWADPDSELAVGYVMNKMAVGTTGDPRSFRLVTAAVEAASKA